MKGFKNTYNISGQWNVTCLAWWHKVGAFYVHVHNNTIKKWILASPYNVQVLFMEDEITLDRYTDGETLSL